MKQTTLLLGFLLSFLSLNAQTLQGPESIEFDYFNNRYLISNTDNGSILARSASGTLSVFKSGISPVPYGIEIMGNTLYACCGGFVKGFDLTSGNEVFSLNLGATFLNGITSDGYQNLFVTDFSAKKIFRVRPAANAFNVMAQNLVQSPNGIVYDLANNRLVFVNWGANAPIKAFSLADSTVSTIASTTLSSCDGLAWNGLDTWYVCNWGSSSVVKFDRNFLNPVTIATGLNSPADMCYNTLSDTLAIPNSGNNTLRFIGFEPIVNVNCNLLPLSVNADSTEFIGTSLSFGDSVLRVQLTNESGLAFAYPLARVTPISALPAGMTFGNGQNGFNVFASSWNSGVSLYAEWFFNVTQSIPENTTLDFRIDVTNLIPSNADTCFFSNTFSVNLNPGNPVKSFSVNQPHVKLYPNPANDQVFLQSSDGTTLVNCLITDLTGKVVSTQWDGNFTSISVSDIPSGLYFLNLKDNTGRDHQLKLNVLH